jgi:hypothetical protein
MIYFAQLRYALTIEVFAKDLCFHTMFYPKLLILFKYASISKLTLFPKMVQEMHKTRKNYIFLYLRGGLICCPGYLYVVIGISIITLKIIENKIQTVPSSRDFDPSSHS